MRLRRQHDDDPARIELAEVAGVASAAAAQVENVTTAEPDPEAAAFFDVDNTIMMGASIFHFARGLAARDFFTTRDLLHFGWQQMSFRLGGQESLEGMREARESALAFVAGREVAEIVRYGEEIYDELMADRIWGGTLALAREHLARGQRVWLVTATPSELAQLIADRLGLTGALGTVAEVSDGVYTGRLVGEPLHGPAKAEAVQALAAREGLDLSRCSAYSDSVNDVPMLSTVGHAVAINPDPDLKAYAREHGWEVHDFRTARKAARIGLPTAAGVGAVAGGVAAGMALRRRHAGHGHLRPLVDAWHALPDQVGHVHLPVAHLPSVHLPATHLPSVRLPAAHLRSARLQAAHLPSVRLPAAHLRSARRSGALPVRRSGRLGPTQPWSHFPSVAKRPAFVPTRTGRVADLRRRLA